MQSDTGVQQHKALADLSVIAGLISNYKVQIEMKIGCSIMQMLWLAVERCDVNIVQRNVWSRFM